MNATTDLLTIAQVCRRIPGARGGQQINPATVTRWILVGCPGRSGVRIKLPAVRAGGRWLIAPNELEAFFVALAATEDTPNPGQSPQHSTSKQRQQAAERAARELERRGA